MTIDAYNDEAFPWFQTVRDEAMHLVSAKVISTGGCSVFFSFLVRLPRPDATSTFSSVTAWVYTYPSSFLTFYWSYILSSWQRLWAMYAGLSTLLWHPFWQIFFAVYKYGHQRRFSHSTLGSINLNGESLLSLVCTLTNRNCAHSYHL